MICASRRPPPTRSRPGVGCCRIWASCRFTHKFGSYPLLVKRMPCRRRRPRRYRDLRVGHTCALVSWREQEAAVEEIEVRSAKHLAFQHLEAIDMALDRSVAPGHGHPSFDRVVVLREPLRKASQGRQRT